MIMCLVSLERQNQLLEEHIVILSKRVSHRVEGMSLPAAGWCAALADGQPSELSEGDSVRIKGDERILGDSDFC